MAFGRSPGKYAVQFITDAPGRLDFNVTTADSLDDAFGKAREAAAINPDFVWDGILIWKDMTAEDVRDINEEMQSKIDSGEAV
jgi:hypothetical protein